MQRAETNATIASMFELYFDYPPNCGPAQEQIEKAMDDFMAWLMSEPVTQGTEIPFMQELTAFAAIHGAATESVTRALPKA